MLESPAAQLYSIDWIDNKGTRIIANFQIVPGNNENQADVVMSFNCFCQAIQTTLLEEQDADT